MTPDPVPVVIENPESIADAETEAEEVDELVEQLTAHTVISEQRHTEILERLNQCRTELDKLSTQTQAENPLLTQVLATLAELKGELINQNSSLDTMLRNQPQNESTPEAAIVVEEIPAELSQENQTDEAPGGNETENKPPERKRPNRFI